MFNKILLASIFIAPLTWSQDYLSISDFYNQLGAAKSFIKMTPIAENQDDILLPLGKIHGANFKYRYDVANYFSTDTDQLINYTNTKPLIDARIKLFKEYSYDQPTASKLYPYSILTYWDILPHPPIPYLNHPKEYYSSTYLDKNINQNPELLSKDFQQKLDELTESQLTTGNNLKLILNGELTSELAKNLLQTKKYLLASNMFMACDDSLTTLRSLMRKKIKEGVKIIMISEGAFTTLKYKSCYKELKKMGVLITNSFGLFKIFKPSKKFVYHNKFWVFDNERAVVFGHNLLDVETESNGFNQKYRDTGVFVQGPIVHQLAKGFSIIHHYLRHKKKTKYMNSINSEIVASISNDLASNKILNKSNYPDVVPNGSCRIVFQGPQQKHVKAINDLYYALFDAAQHNVFATSVRLPTLLDFKNNETVSKLVQMLYQKTLTKPNFQVDIVTNNWMGATDVPSKNYKNSGFLTLLYKLFSKGNSTKGNSSNASHTNVDNLNGVRSYLGANDRKSNINVWTYFNYYHAKTALIDNTLSVIGSYNINRNSTERSFEMSLVCADSKLISEAQSANILDIINSVPLLD